MADTIVQKKTISGQVADFIRQRILSGQYEGGLRLRQEHLAAEIGVSRIPVREALHQLHSEGFVTLVSQKGAIVSQISDAEIMEMFELRARIETWLLSLAIPRMTELDLQKAGEAADRYDRESENDELHILNWAFHRALYAPSRRNISIDMVEKIHLQIERYTRLMNTLVDGHAIASREHRALLDLCKARDTLRAMSLLDNHIVDAGKSLIERFEFLKKND